MSDRRRLPALWTVSVRGGGSGEGGGGAGGGGSGGGGAGASSDVVGEMISDSSSPPPPSSVAAAAAEEEDDDDVLSNTFFRTAGPTDVPRCHSLTTASAAASRSSSGGASVASSDQQRPFVPPMTKSELQYVQHHAAQYFRVAIRLSMSPTLSTDSMKMGGGDMLGYVCAVRRSPEAVAAEKEGGLGRGKPKTHHDPRGSLLVVRSVYVSEGHRRKGLGTAMVKDYVRSARRMAVKAAEAESSASAAAGGGGGAGADSGDKKSFPRKMVLTSPPELLGWFVRCGFRAVGVRPDRGGDGGGGDRFECELDLLPEAKLSGNPTGAPLARAGGGPGKAIAGAGVAGCKCWIVNAFADAGNGNAATATGGSPVAVVLFPKGTKFEGMAESRYRWMQTVANEFNLSETGFLWEKKRRSSSSSSSDNDDDSDGESSEGEGTTEGTTGGASSAGPLHYRIKSFVPSYSRMVKASGLVGTKSKLAAASVLLSEDKLQPMEKDGDETAMTQVPVSSLILQRSPPHPSITARRRRILDNGGPPSSSSSRTIIDLSSYPIRHLRPVDKLADRTAILGMLRSAFDLSDPNDDGIRFLGMDSVGEDVFVELHPIAFRKALETKVRVEGLASWGGGYTRGVILCARCDEDEDGDDSDGNETAGERADFLCRFFGPKAGMTDEDAVTPKAFATLGPYFSSRCDRATTVGRQVRGGDTNGVSGESSLVVCSLNEDGRTVSVGGAAVVAMSGTLHL